jgi:hypothetical protein
MSLQDELEVFYPKSEWLFRACSTQRSGCWQSSQSILRPVEIENPALADVLHQAALFGEQRIFNPALGVQREIKGETLTLRQEREQHQVSINEQGSVRVMLPVRLREERPFRNLFMRSSKSKLLMHWLTQYGY